MPTISICIDVSDMKKGIEFYTKAIGCDLVNENDEYTELSAEGVTVYLVEREEGSNPLINGEAQRSFKRHWTPVHLDVKVTDLEGCVALVEELGGVKEGENSGDWGSIAFCSDPFGNGFCVMKLSVTSS